MQRVKQKENKMSTLCEEEPGEAKGWVREIASVKQTMLDSTKQIREPFYKCPSPRACLKKC